MIPSVLMSRLDLRRLYNKTVAGLMTTCISYFRYVRQILTSIGTKCEWFGFSISHNLYAMLH